MQYNFSWGWFFGGLMIIVGAIIFLRFYQMIADNIGAGVADYQKYRLYGLIALGIGFLALTNIAPLILHAILNAVFGRR